MAENRRRELIATHVDGVVDESVGIVEPEKALVKAAPHFRSFPNFGVIDAVARSLNETVMDLHGGVADLENRFVIRSDTPDGTSNEMLFEAGLLQLCDDRCRSLALDEDVDILTWA